MRRTAGNLWRAAALGVLTTGGPLAAGAADDLELGECLAAECTACHDPSAVGRGIPNIVGMPRVVFVQAMEQYRSGARINEVMRNVARSLGDEEVAALAAYLEQASRSR
jgi:cytochrome c